MAATSSREANKRIARQIPEAVATEGDIDRIDDVCTADVVDHSPLGEVEGREELKEQMRMVRAAFGGFSATVEESIGEGDLVAMRVRLSGTHDGEFMGYEATGEHYDVQNMVFTRIEDGQIAERWVLPDMHGMLTQVGILEAPAP